MEDDKNQTHGINQSQGGQGDVPQQNLPPQQPVYSQDMSGMQQKLPNSTGALVLGILSLVFCGLIGLILGLIGLSQGSKAIAMYNANQGAYTLGSYKNAKAGKTCALIGVILGPIALIIVLIVNFANF